MRAAVLTLRSSGGDINVVVETGVLQHAVTPLPVAPAETLLRQVTMAIGLLDAKRGETDVVRADVQPRVRL